MSKKHSRYFLIFDNEDTGFGISSDKEPTGYAKIESKRDNCKITLYAQNLKTEKGPYIGYLVDSTKSPAIVARLGEISLDESGKGEMHFEEDVNNICGTGLSADKFNVAAVVKEGNRLQVPLAGYYAKEKVKWKDKVNSRSFVRSEEIIEEEKASMEEEVENIVSEAEEEVIEENRDIVEEASTIIQEDCNEEASNIIEDDYNEEVENILSDYDEQLQRDDNSYVDKYSEEGMKFKHYEEEINLQDNDSLYATMMTMEEDVEEQIEEVNEDIEDTLDTLEEEYLYDARDINLNEEDSILLRALKNINRTAQDLKNNKNIDFEGLSKEIDKEVKNIVGNEIMTYKERLLSRICNDESSDNSTEAELNRENDNSKFDIEGISFQSKDEEKSSIVTEDNKNDEKSQTGYAKKFHSILKDYEEVKVRDMKDCRLWKIKDRDSIPQKDDKDYLYYNSIFHLKMTYPYINYNKYFKDRGHYYFGIKYDKAGEVKYLIYGIEGEKKESKQPYKGMTGFVTHIPFEKEGMWTMYYNPYTGCVMLPKRKNRKKR